MSNGCTCTCGGRPMPVTGHITAVPGLTRSEKHRLVGNGVCPQPGPWNSSSRSTPTRTTRCLKSPPMTSSSPTTAHYTTPLRPGLTGRRTWGSGMTPKPGTSADGRTVWVVETHGERYEFDGTLVLVNGRIDRSVQFVHIMKEVAA